jgi:hypothetical protein
MTAPIARMTINELLADHQEFHSDLQMDSFITLRSGGTLYGCYKQALRELQTRKVAVIQRVTQMRLADVEARRRAITTGNEMADERNRIRNEELAAFRPMNEQILNDTLRECAYFYGQALAIREALEAEGVRFPLDARTRDRLDREMWEHNLKGRCAVELMSQGRLNGTTIELIQSCPQEIRGRIGDCLSPERHSALIDWFMTCDSPAPPPKVIEVSEVRKLIECSGLNDSPRLS